MEQLEELNYSKEKVIKLLIDGKKVINGITYRSDDDAYKINQIATELASSLEKIGHKNTTYIKKPVRNVVETDGRKGRQERKKKFDECKRDLLEDINQQLFYLENTTTEE